MLFLNYLISMCFSTTASFGASAVLAIAGVAAVKKTQSSSQIVFACIPILFSIQQFTEGFVWIALTSNQYRQWQPIPIYAFLIIAQVIWPIWVPLSFFLLEKNIKRKKTLSVFLAIGCLLSLYLSGCLFFCKVSAVINPYHVFYDIDFPHKYIPIVASFYFLPIIIPPFISSVKRTTLLGSLIFLSFLITKLFFHDYVISVWCFFAALVSLLVYMILNDLKVSGPFKIDK
jgi:hypothetical protein